MAPVHCAARTIGSSDLVGGERRSGSHPRRNSWWKPSVDAGDLVVRRGCGKLWRLALREGGERRSRGMARLALARSPSPNAWEPAQGPVAGRYDPAKPGRKRRSGHFLPLGRLRGAAGRGACDQSPASQHRSGLIPESTPAIGGRRATSFASSAFPSL